MNKTRAIVHGFAVSVPVLALCALAFAHALQSSTVGGQDLSRSKSAPVQANPSFGNLLETDTIKFSIPAPQFAIAGAKCDPSGNMYVRLGSAQQLAVMEAHPRMSTEEESALTPISRLDLSSREEITYASQAIPDYAFEALVSYNVSADGTLYTLIVAHKEDPYKVASEATYFLEKYNNDGTFDSRVELSAPPFQHFRPSTFGVFGDGTFLVAGASVAPGPPGAVVRKPLFAVYSATGSFLREVQFRTEAPEAKRNDSNDSGEEGLRIWATGHPNIVSTSQGSIYLVQSTNPVQIAVILPGGQVEKTLRAKSPVVGAVPMETGLIGADSIYVHFGSLPVYPAPKNPAKDMIGVFNVARGAFDTFYPIDSLSGLSIGGDAAGHILMLSSSDDGHLEIVEYALG